MRLARLLIATAILLTAGTFAAAQAQSIFIFGGTQTIVSTVETLDVEGKVDVRNNGDATANVKVRMIVEEKMEGQDIYFCWDQCFPPTIMESGVVEIPAGGSSDLFSAHVNPNGIAGKSKVCFEFFLENEPTAVQTVCFEFDIKTATSVDDLGSPLASAKLASFPSPAVESVELSFAIPTVFSNAQLSIHNLFGNEMATLPITTQEGSTLLNVSGYNPGVYFYTLTVDNQRLLSKKFVVKR